MTGRPLGPGTWTVGLDIGGTKVHGVLLDEDGTRASTVRLPTGAGITGVVASAAQAVERLAADRCLDLGEVSAVGVGVPGVVDPSSGVVAHAVNLGITGEVRLAALLSDRLGGVPVNVENDLNAAALGAAVGRGPRGDLAFLALGTGLAAGLVLDGAVRRGISGAAGEVGHLPYAPHGPRCACR
ncbi:ROK family protein, partial [Actinotalea sp. C106]|uniref:ROK family protein n=1 Tax=Actinotalea sp. C106 TaxID=2908644 RepID=UPI00202960B5